MTTVDMKNIMTVAVGGIDRFELLEALRKNDVLINEYGEQLLDLDVFTTSQPVLSIDVVILSVSDLGFLETPTTEMLFGRARYMGMELGPIELAPYLRLQYLDQPKGTLITVATERADLGKSDPSGFYLQRRDEGLWLRGYKADASHRWELSDLFIFCADNARPVIS